MWHIIAVVNMMKSSFLWVFLSWYIAPSHKRKVAIIFSVLLIMLNAIAVSLAVFYGYYASILYFIVLVASTIFLVSDIPKDEKQNSY